MEGVIAAVPTPVDAAGRPRRAAFLEHGRWALANGCDGLNILGTTGEANSFGTVTRQEIMAWAAEGLDVSRLMVGTGTPALAESIDLTARADALGYRVALVLPPYYYTPPSQEGLIDWYLVLHAALGDRNIALYFYNYPQMTGFPIPIEVIETLHDAHPGRFSGIKDSSGDLDYCRALTARIPGLRVFPSNEAALGEAVTTGFAGCISATANVSAPLCGALWARREHPDPALIAEVSGLRQAVAAWPLIPAIKHMVGRRMEAADWRHVLPPFRPLAPEARAALDEIELPQPTVTDAAL